MSKTVEEMSEEIARDTTLCPEGKEPRCHTCLTTSCTFCWQQASDSEIRAAYEKMKKGAAHE